MNEPIHGPEIAVHIDELIVDGARGIDRAHLAAAVESELGRLVAALGMRPTAATHARLNGGTITLPAGVAGVAGKAAGDSGAVGRRVAQAVHGAIGGAR